jgi:hypothetical protein
MELIQELIFQEEEIQSVRKAWEVVGDLLELLESTSTFCGERGECGKFEDFSSLPEIYFALEKLIGLMMERINRKGK